MGDEALLLQARVSAAISYSTVAGSGRFIDTTTSSRFRELVSLSTLELTFTSR